MYLMATDTSAQRAPMGGRGAIPKATLLLKVSYERPSRDKCVQPQREPHALLAPDTFWLLLPTTFLSGVSVGAHE